MSRESHMKRRRQSKMFYRPSRRRRCQSSRLHPWGLGGAADRGSSLAGRLPLSFKIFRCLFRDGFATAATFQSQHMVLPVLSLIRGVWSCMSGGYSGIRSNFLFVRVVAGLALLIFIGDGCCSSTLVLRGLSAMNSCVSTITNSSTTSFTRVQ